MDKHKINLIGIENKLTVIKITKKMARIMRTFLLAHGGEYLKLMVKDKEFRLLNKNLDQIHELLTLIQKDLALGGECILELEKPRLKAIAELATMRKFAKGTIAKKRTTKKISLKK